MAIREKKRCVMCVTNEISAREHQLNIKLVNKEPTQRQIEMSNKILCNTVTNNWNVKSAQTHALLVYTFCVRRCLYPCSYFT